MPVSTRLRLSDPVPPSPESLHCGPGAHTLPLHGEQNSAPLHVHFLIPGTCDYGLLHGKRDMAGVIKDPEYKEIILDIQVDPLSSQGSF